MKSAPSGLEATVGIQTAISGTWMVGARLIARMFDLVTMLTLAHILRPQDFGLVAIAMTVIYILEAALELPISQALVRLPVITPAHYDTAFTLSALRGMLLSLLVCGISVPFSRIYGDSRITPLVCLLSLAPAARGLLSPRLADYAKNLNFTRDFYIELTGKVVAFSCALLISTWFRSYWAIAVGTIVAPVTGAILSYILAPYRPRLTLCELSSFSGFLGWITIAQVISATNWQFDRLMLGKLTSRFELGLFTTSNDAASIPLQTLSGPILRPLLSAFSLVKHDLNRLQSCYQSSASALFTLALPILVGESLIAKPAVTLMFGASWSDAVPMLRWLAISLIPSLFAIPLAPLVMSLDRTQTFVKRNSLEICVKIPLVVLGAIKYRFMGVIAARLISETVTAFYCMYVVRNTLRLTIVNQLRALWRAILSAIAMTGALAITVPSATQSTAALPLLAGTLFCIGLGAFTYASTLLLLWFGAGCPQGIEALTVHKALEVLRRPSPQPVSR